MVFNLVIPEIENKPKNTKDVIISMLTTEWPLTLRNIYFKIKKKYRYSSSYQAVYKAVKELVDAEVLIAKDKRYEMNIKWIKELQSFTDIVETNYYAKERLQDLSGIQDSKRSADIMVLNFDTIFDAEKYLYYFMKSELSKKLNDSICYLVNNEWRPIYYLRAEYNYYRKFKEKGHKFYFLCSGNSMLEGYCGKFYKKIGINFKMSKEKITNDILVFGDYFINIYIPEEIKIKLKKGLYKKDIIGILKEVLEKKSNIRVVVTKDKALANEIKLQITRKFK